MLLASILCCACSSGQILVSRHIAATESTPAAGIGYYLPKKLITVTVWGYEAAVATPNRTDAADGALPQAPTTMRYFATYDGESIVPDLRHQFLIVPRWDAASHDTVHVELTEEGFLKSVMGRAVDQRADIALELAKLASLLIKGPAPMPSKTRGLGAEDPTVPRMVAQYEFDPVDPVGFGDVREQLSGFGIQITVTKQSACPTATSGEHCCTTCRQTSPGVYYRLPVPYRVHLEPGGMYRQPLVDGSDDQATWEVLDHGLERTVLLPNNALCMYVPVERHMFVTSETSMTFDRGMLTSVTTDKPSELLGFVRIPVDVASTILAIPSELLTIRIQQKTQEQEFAAAESALATSQSDLLKAELELLEAMEKYQKAKAGKDPRNGN